MRSLAMVSVAALTIFSGHALARPPAAHVAHAAPPSDDLRKSIDQDNQAIKDNSDALKRLDAHIGELQDSMDALRKTEAPVTVTLHFRAAGAELAAEKFCEASSYLHMQMGPLKESAPPGETTFWVTCYL